MISSIIYGSFMLHGLTAQEPDAGKIIGEFKRNSMDRYKDLADSLLTGWVLDAQQQFSIGDEIAKVKADKDKTGAIGAYATCPVNGKIKLLHAFDSANFVPIGNTPFEAVQLLSLGDRLSGDKPQTISGVLDGNGMGSIDGCLPNSQYRIRFYPNVSQGEIDKLYASYDGVIGKLHDWLHGEWSGSIAAQWKLLAPVGDPKRLAQINQAFLDGMGGALMAIWDDVKKLYDILTNLDKYYDKLRTFISEADFQKLKAQAKELMHTVLMIVSDEPLMFLYASAVVCWVQLLPPTVVAVFTSQLVSGLLLDVLLGIVLTGGAGLAVRYSVKAAKGLSGGTAGLLEKALQSLINISKSHALKPHAEAVKPLAARGEVLVNSSQKATVQVKSPAQGINLTEPDTLGIRRRKTRNTRVTKADAVDDASAPAKTPNDQPAVCEAKTCKDGEPVSMVTGEELLSLTDGELDGLLAFPWTRLYRSSAAELDRGLGYGWSHSLAHRLDLEGEELVWTDHENLRTSFPLPSQQRPVITNRLSSAAIYLGEDPAELILAQAGKTPRFYHFRHDPQGGYLIAISDAYGNRLNLSRDLLGRIQRLSNTAGRALKLCYEGRHIAAVEYQIQRPADNQEDSWQTVQTLVRYRYNAAGQLLEASNALGETERYRYDEANVILERQLAGGAAFFWEWQGEGKQARCSHHWASYGQMDTRYSWDDKGGVTVLYADGSQQCYEHDGNARLVKQVDPDGAQSLKSYDEKGQLIAEQDALGAITEYRYDQAGRLSAVIPPEDQPTTYEYRDGFVSAVQRGEATWAYRRNAQGDITAQTDPHGHTTQYSYDAQGRLLAIRHPDGSSHKLAWNPLGQLLEEQLPSGGERRYRYDAQGRQITRQDESGAITQYQWDAVGRLTQVSLPGGGSRAFSYNAYGKVTGERDELGRITRYEYADGLHLVSRRINPDGSQLRYRYDNARLLLTDIENERGEHYRLDYHPNGLIQRETAFDGRSTAYVYDLNGHLIEKTEFGEDGSQLVTAYQRDSAGRLLVKTLADGEQIHYAYDALGRLVGVDDGQWPLAYRYDLQDRLIEEHQGWASLRYEYDALGQLSHCRLPDGSRLDYRHQSGGALAAIDLNGQTLTVHQFSPGGREQLRQQGALRSEYQYDEQGRLLAHSLGQERQRLLQRHYRYDATGNLAGIDDSRKGSKSYHYDPLDRLLAVRGDTPENFVHDPAGTLLAQSGAVAEERVNVKGNRLLMQGDRHFDYDAFGNLIRERRGAGQKLLTEYRYDNQHRLIGTSLPDGRQVTYRYDAFGRRIAKTVDGQSTEFLWQGERLIAESGPGHYRSYLYEPGSFRPLAMLQGKGQEAEPFYYQLDHLGTPQELTSAAGEILWSVKYRAYGNVAKLEIAEVDNPLRFQGQYHDAETGLHYNRHRYYNPNTGSYLTPDPIKLAGGLNNYQYVPNPTGWVDPLGLTGECPGGDGNKAAEGKTDNAATGVDEGEPDAPQTGGAARASMYSANWPKASLNGAVEKFAGPNPSITTTDKGKRIYKNSQSGVEVVEDVNGNYFRIYDPSLSGKRRYLSLEGVVPNNKTLPNGKQAGRTQSEYNQDTHYNIDENQ